jgi:hypothetical protein
MSTEIQQDPYTLVAHHLQEGEATRAKLKELTELGYAAIQAALERFEIMETVEIRTDGMGVEHYSWKGEGYKPDPPRLVSQPEPPKQAVEIAKDGVADEAELRVNTHGRPAGWSLAAKTREFLAEVDPPDEQFSLNEIYDFLVGRYPNACETYEVGALRSQLTSTLNSFVGKEIVLVSRGVGRYPNLYEKKIETAIDPSRVEALVAAGCTTTEMCAELGVSVATWTRHRKANPKLEDAHAKGLKRARALNDLSEKVSAKKPDRNGQEPLSKSRQDAAEKRTTETPETAVVPRFQPVALDKVEDTSESPKSGNFITTNRVTDDVASFSPSNEEANRASYALPAFIADLRAERDELDQLITLLERRMTRAG